MKDDKNNFQQMEFNNNFNYDTEDLNLQHYSLNEEINENNYNNNLLNGLNSDLNVLLANLKSSKSTDKMRYNISNTKLKSPSQYKTDTNNISNFNLIDEFNNLVENNSRRNINYFSPVHFQDPILIKEKLSRKKNISHISNPKIKNNENSFLTKTDYINGCFNENSNYFFSQPINIKKNDNYYLNQRRTLNINNQRNVHHSKKLNNSNTNRLVNNNKILNFNDNNVSNQNFEISELYELIKKIGRGGMSVVYLAQDADLGKLWAVKEVKDAHGLARREAEILKRIDHPAFPRIVDVLSEGGRLYIVMDYIEGETLEECIQREIREELDIGIAVDAPFGVYKHNREARVHHALAGLFRRFPHYGKRI